MALFDIFKKKEKPRKTIKRKLSPAPVQAASKKPEDAPKTTAASGPKKISGCAYRILKGPRVTEKATELTSQNKYLFEVFRASNKNEIKHAIEDVYGVEVVSVRIMGIPGKKRRLGRISGWKGGGKKAIVQIKEGQKIEVLPR